MYEFDYLVHEDSQDALISHRQCLSLIGVYSELNQVENSGHQLSSLD